MKRTLLRLGAFAVLVLIPLYVLWRERYFPAPQNTDHLTSAGMLRGMLVLLGPCLAAGWLVKKIRSRQSN
jgi:hypothetical protein